MRLYSCPVKAVLKSFEFPLIVKPSQALRNIDTIILFDFSEGDTCQTKINLRQNCDPRSGFYA